MISENFKNSNKLHDTVMEIKMNVNILQSFDPDSNEYRRLYYKTEELINSLGV